MHDDSTQGTLASEDGFTLIELAMVLLIISILMMTAVPTYMGQKNIAYDIQSKANLHNGVIAAKAYFVENESYSGVNATTLKGLERGIIFEDAPDNDCTDDPYTVDDQGKIYIVNASQDAAMLCSYSKGSKKPFSWAATGNTDAYNF